MHSSDALAPSRGSLFSIVDAANGIIVDVDAIPFKISTGEKRKGRECRGWQHFTKVEKKPGECEECMYNPCGHLYVCYNRSRTTHLNRDIFDGGCSIYKPILNESEKFGSHGKQESEDYLYLKPLRYEQSQSIFTEQAHLAQPRDQNIRLQRKRDGAAAEKATLEQLIVTMKAETACLAEENTKLKEECTRIQEEKQRIVTREEIIEKLAAVFQKEDSKNDHHFFFFPKIDKYIYETVLQLFVN
ncbi:hypothetical protein ACJRO7_003476 [Eucalyptus globulus]|uniref:Uncharacterized protein n=1 Tax=Eucalyptus globulus TaxID=34317 RepID=A0ABD3IUQ1_EUCGL